MIRSGEIAHAMIITAFAFLGLVPKIGLEGAACPR